MKKNHKYFFIIFIASGTILSLSSCVVGGGIADPYIVPESRQKNNIYYVPSAPNAPLLTEKNDISFSAMRSSASQFTGTEIEAAWLAWKHVGISGSYSDGSNKSTELKYTKYNRFEVGSGYITQLSKGWHFETYAGLGNGKIMNFHYTGSSKLNLTHFFLQPAIAISNKNKTVQFGFISRFEAVNFNVMDTLFNNDREPFTTTQVRSLYDHPFHVMLQPGFVFRFGWKNFLFHSSYSFSSDLTNPDLYRAKDNFSLGVSLRFNTAGKVIAK